MSTSETSTHGKSTVTPPQQAYKSPSRLSERSEHSIAGPYRQGIRDAGVQGRLRSSRCESHNDLDNSHLSRGLKQRYKSKPLPLNSYPKPSSLTNRTVVLFIVIDLIEALGEDIDSTMHIPIGKTLSETDIATQQAESVARLKGRVGFSGHD
jgi:hypothetical protein